MRQVFFVVFKKQLKTKSTLIIFGICVALSILMIIASISGERSSKLLENGKSIKLKGIPAIQETAKRESQIIGELTPNKLLAYYETYMELYNQYGKNIPEEEYIKKLLPYRNIHGILPYAHDNVYDLNQSSEIHDLTVDQIENFYQQLEGNRNHYFAKSNMSSVEIKKAQEMSDGITIPFQYQSFLGWETALEYLGILSIFLSIAIACIAAPIIANDRKDGSDELFWCTKYGKLYHIGAKLLSLIVLSSFLYFVSIGIYTLIAINSLGTAGLKTSIQFINPIATANLTLKDIYLKMILAGCVSNLGLIAFCTLLSSLMKSAVIVQSLSVVLIAAPTIMRFFVATSNKTGHIICNSFVTSGLGIFYELIGSKFICFGSYCIWTPNYIFIATIITSVIFGLLLVATNRKYRF